MRPPSIVYILSYILLASTCPSLAFAQPASASSTPAPPARPDDPALDQHLAQERWREYAHGISFRVPLGSRVTYRSSDDALVRVLGEEGYAVTLYVTESRQPTSLGTVVNLALQRRQAEAPDAVSLAEAEVRIAGKPGALMYYRVPAPSAALPGRTPAGGQPDLVLGQALLMISPTAFANIRLEATTDTFDKARPIYDALLRSITLDDPARLAQRRQDMLDRGSVWLQTVSFDTLAKSLVPEQWLRVTDSGRDVGYMKITQEAANEMGMPGVRVAYQFRIDIHDQAVDSLSSFFLSRDRTREVWSIRTTVRPLKPSSTSIARPGGAKPQPPQPLQTWAESGIRAKDVITVTREGPTGGNKHEWKTPPESYLSQAETFLMAPLLPRRTAQDLGFYTYYPNSGSIVFRSDRVVPAADGTFAVYSRAAQEQPEQLTVYDSQGRLLRRELPTGQLVLPATRAQIAALWKLQ